MNRNRWLIGGLVVGLIAVGFIGIARAKQRMAAQQHEQALALAESAPTIVTQATPSGQPQLAALATSSQTTAAVASASAPMPSTSGEMGGPIEIQTALANAGFYQGTIDGKLGPKTQQAIKDFQSAHGLTADGRVGPKTWSALQPFLSAQQSTQPPAAQ